MGLILVSHPGLFLSTVPTVLGQPHSSLTLRELSLTQSMNWTRYNSFGPFLLKLCVQYSSNYGYQGFCPLTPPATRLAVVSVFLSRLAQASTIYAIGPVSRLPLFILFSFPSARAGFNLLLFS